MKKIICVIGLLAVILPAIFAQNAELPRLAVVEFNTNINNEKIKGDVIMARNVVESQMVATQKYRIITRDDIDKLLENQRIQVSSISSAENLTKLKLQNISYIVTGSVNAMGNDYAVIVRVLDVSTGQFSHSDNAFMGGSPQDLYNGIRSLITKFVAGMSATAGGAIVQGTVVSPSGISIEVSVKEGGDLYFQNKLVATLWDNDKYTIPIETPGTYSLKLVSVDNKEKSTSVTISSRGITNVDFSSIPIIYTIGKIGPAGGLIFYDKGSYYDGWRYLEAAPSSTGFESTWDEAVVRCNNINIAGFSDWRLPDINELKWMYDTVIGKRLGGFSYGEYWSSLQRDNDRAVYLGFNDGRQRDGRKSDKKIVRAVRSF